MINTKVHAVIDYLLGLVLVAMPWLLEYRAAGPQYLVPLFVGCLSILLASTTQFEYSIVKLLSLRFHLSLDVISGVVLACSPWLFGFKPAVFKPHLVFGLTQLAVAVLTDRMLYDKVKNLRAHKDQEGKPII